MQAQTIQEVIDRLTEIVNECRLKNSPLGFFASLYRTVTIRVRDGIIRGEFEDNTRMEKLDILFAQRYIDAYETYGSGKDATQSWMIAFKAAEKNEAMIIQHLLLGMNAHINLDLGIAAVETVGNEKLESIKNDFNKINAILSELVDEVQDKIGSVSPLFRILDPLTSRLDEMLVNFSINLARDGAWKFASELFIANKHDYKEAINNRDFIIARIAEQVANPKNGWLKTVISIIRLFESKNVSKIIDAMA